MLFLLTMAVGVRCRCRRCCRAADVAAVVEHHLVLYVCTNIMCDGDKWTSLGLAKKKLQARYIHLMRLIQR